MEDETAMTAMSDRFLMNDRFLIWFIGLALFLQKTFDWDVELTGMSYRSRRAGNRSMWQIAPMLQFDNENCDKS